MKRRFCSVVPLGVLLAVVVFMCGSLGAAAAPTETEPVAQPNAVEPAWGAEVEQALSEPDRCQLRWLSQKPAKGVVDQPVQSEADKLQLLFLSQRPARGVAALAMTSEADRLQLLFLSNRPKKGVANQAARAGSEFRSSPFVSMAVGPDGQLYVGDPRMRSS